MSPAANSARDNSEAGSLSMVRQLTGKRKIMLIKRGSQARRNAPQQYELRVQPNTQTFSHIEYRGNQWNRTRPESHRSLAVNATVGQPTYSQAKNKAPKVANGRKVMKLTHLCFKQAKPKMCHSPKVDDGVDVFVLLLECIFLEFF